MAYFFLEQSVNIFFVKIKKLLIVIINLKYSFVST